MKCHECGTEWPEGMAFCGECGTRLQLRPGGTPLSEREVFNELSQKSPDPSSSHSEEQAQNESVATPQGRVSNVLCTKQEWRPGETILNEFVVEKKIGAGGMGAVYLVVGKQFINERFAVKRVLRPDNAGRINFLRELQIWIDMPPHPHLTACRFFRTVGDELTIFAEYVEGGSLSEWIADRKLTSLGQILDVAIQFAWGLHAAHQLGVNHLDVKPENVLMTPDGIAKVTDFGLTRSHFVEPLQIAGISGIHGWRDTVSGSGSMTRAYASPEQAEGRPLNTKTDIWSWGASLLEMFAGGVFWISGPLVEESLQAFLDEGGQAKGLPAMPPEVVNVLHRCFQLDTAKRWSTILEAADMLALVYEKHMGRTYPRLKPNFEQLLYQRVFRHDRSTKYQFPWSDPRIWLEQALRLAGRKPSESEFLQLRGYGSRKAHAIADLATYEEVCRICEILISRGHRGIEKILADMWLQKSLVHTFLDDVRGTVAVLDKAIAKYERMVYQEERTELTNLLGTAYQNKALALHSLKDHSSAVVQAEKAIDLFERLAHDEKNLEARHHLAMAWIQKATFLMTLGDNSGATLLVDKTIAFCEPLLPNEEHKELAYCLARAYGGKAGVLHAMGDNQGSTKLLDKSIALYERLVHEEGHIELAEELAGSYTNKSRVLLSLGDHSGAAALCDKAIAIQTRVKS